jgi:hypothetical protein
MSQTASAEEQSICVTCGFCCDGTLFLYANLDPGEAGQLPELIELNRFEMNGKEYFRQPCRYFSGKCSIYSEKRANICSAYICQLIRDFRTGKISEGDALDLIREAAVMRDDLIAAYRKLTGAEGPMTFRQLLSELGKMTSGEGPKEKYQGEADLLLAKANILETLLIRHMRSETGFESMAAKPED